jgi:hypothetical protein
MDNPWPLCLACEKEIKNGDTFNYDGKTAAHEDCLARPEYRPRKMNEARALVVINHLGVVIKGR